MRSRRHARAPGVAAPQARARLGAPRGSLPPRMRRAPGAAPWLSSRAGAAERKCRGASGMHAWLRPRVNEAQTSKPMPVPTLIPTQHQYPHSHTTTHHPPPTPHTLTHSPIHTHTLARAHLIGVRRALLRLGRAAVHAAVPLPHRDRLARRHARRPQIVRRAARALRRRRRREPRHRRRQQRARARPSHPAAAAAARAIGSLPAISRSRGPEALREALHVRQQLEHVALERVQAAAVGRGQRRRLVVIPVRGGAGRRV